jgi:hypothetical protein
VPDAARNGAERRSTLIASERRMRYVLRCHV